MNIKELAEQAGANDRTLDELEKFIDLERFAELVAAAEREACAKLCEKAVYWDGHVAASCAAAIKARGET